MDHKIGGGDSRFGGGNRGGGQRWSGKREQPRKRKVAGIVVSRDPSPLVPGDPDNRDNIAFYGYVRMRDLPPVLRGPIPATAELSFPGGEPMPSTGVVWSTCFKQVHQQFLSSAVCRGISPDWWLLCVGYTDADGNSDMQLGFTGTVDPGEVSLFSTVCREGLEECGLDLSSERPFYHGVAKEKTQDWELFAFLR